LSFPRSARRFGLLVFRRRGARAICGLHAQSDSFNSDNGRGVNRKFAAKSATR
jgi:hypothetical protein